MMDSIGPIRVLVLETEPQIIANARAALEGDNRLVLVGAVNDQPSLLDKLGSTYAHVAVIDIAGIRGDVGPAVHEILAHALDDQVLLKSERADAIELALDRPCIHVGHG